jgi:uncharacterized membrane protein
LLTLAGSQTVKVSVVREDMKMVSQQAFTWMCVIGTFFVFHLAYTIAHHRTLRGHRKLLFVAFLGLATAVLAVQAFFGFSGEPQDLIKGGPWVPWVFLAALSIWTLWRIVSWMRESRQGVAEPQSGRYR